MAPKSTKYILATVHLFKAYFIMDLSSIPPYPGASGTGKQRDNARLSKQVH